MLCKGLGDVYPSVNTVELMDLYRLFTLPSSGQGGVRSCIERNGMEMGLKAFVYYVQNNHQLKKLHILA